jgi:ribulose-phosphate 3-epimerase
MRTFSRNETGLSISYFCIYPCCRFPLPREIKTAESAGVDAIHVDVMDGVFVPNISMGPMIVETCRKITSLPLDVHLMIIHPENYLTSFQNAGADSISIHIEDNKVVGESLKIIKQTGCRAGLVLNPETSLHEIDNFLMLADYFLVMTVHPGFGGQKFIEESLHKIHELAENLFSRNLEKTIQVDGGINTENISDLAVAGAHDFVAGNSIFKHPKGILAGVKSLREALK